MAYQDITADEIEVGLDITAWFNPDGNSGQGGIVTRIAESFFEMESGTAKFHHSVKFADVHHFTVERPLPAEECVDFSDDCRGPVEWCPTPPHGTSSRKRCEEHNNRRWDRFSDPASSERFAHSDVAPPGFNRSWGGANEYGEHFEEDY